MMEYFYELSDFWQATAVSALFITYCGIGRGTFNFLVDKLDWNRSDPGPFFASCLWLPFLFYWMMIGWPVMLVKFSCGRMTRVAKRARSRTIREVK
jgi:hypothetical protein